ncbi:MAG: 2-C-methyl-D-erythritol 2,4-cyclodiphosphate synthase [Clostridia bacterium]
MRIGNGYDVHKLVEGRKLILGGVDIPNDVGLLGHSDADVLVHAIMDAILGSLALGDIGKFFPDSDNKYKGISSLTLLSYTAELIREQGYKIGNIDGIIVAEKPKLAPFIDQMRENIATSLGVAVNKISVKATTEEGLGFTGIKAGISSYAVALLTKI